jgi:hypothetical protein
MSVIKTLARRERGAIGGLAELSVCIAVGAALTLGGLFLLFQGFTASANTTVCSQNEIYLGDAAVQSAADANGVFPADTTAITLTTAGFAGYLGSKPNDPANPTGSYSFTNTTANGLPSFTITCPGGHGNNSMRRFSGYSSTSTTINYNYQSGFTAS